MLLRKMLRELRLNSGQFISIFLLSLLAIFLFTGVAGEVAGVQNARTDFHKQSNLADGWVYGNGFTAEQTEQLAALPEVGEAERRMYMEVKAQNGTTLFFYLPDTNTVNMPMVLEGEPFQTSDAEHIWLAKRFADEQGVAVGDTFTLTLPDGSPLALQVAGKVWSPEYEYYKAEVDLEPDYHDTGYAFASPEVISGIMEYSADQLVYTADTDDLDACESTVSSALGGKYSVMLRRNGITNLTAVDDEIAQHKMMGVLFPAFFVIIAILTTVTTMKRIVERQRTQIGTFKAIGMKKRKIYLHYLSYGFFPSLVGAVIGTLTGPFTLSPMLFRMKYYLDSSDEYMLPRFNVVYPFYFWLLGLVIVAFCTLAAWMSCRNIMKIRPSEALRPATPKSTKSTAFEKLPFWNKLSFSIRYTLRDFARNKSRTIFGLAGTVSCMALMLCGFAAKHNFQNAVTELYAEKLLNNSAMITVQTNAPLDEAERIRDMVSGELVMSDTTEIRLPGNSDKMSCHINIYENSSIANVLSVRLEPEKLSDNDFTLTQKTADQLGVKTGDEVEWHIYGSDEWVRSTVTMITRAPFEQGIVTTRDIIESAGYTFRPTRLLTHQDVTEDLKNESSVIDNVNSKSALADMLNNYLELVNMVMGFMLLLAILLAVIVLYSLGLMSFEERQKEMATLKVLGFRSQKLRGLMLRQNLVLAVAGILLGIPLGAWMLRMLIRSLGDSMDVPTFVPVSYILISGLVTFIVSAAVNLLFTKKIRRMDMVAEIKSAE